MGRTQLTHLSERHVRIRAHAQSLLWDLKVSVGKLLRWDGPCRINLLTSSSLTLPKLMARRRKEYSRAA
ncbi:hypothetical protein PoB_004028700 [Plakobranchus ocellatus]|uniref:Uncharacterized protein n=1 Tax=Plakobranchus ocellatus TaxID=259542 RepID=A0AAV4B3H9_9GAST|nr:hypothetical protein PoB_004028700 [Plakobranchus ocellatus]